MRLLLSLLAVSMFTTASAEDSHPETFAGLLKKGIHLGIIPNQEAGTISVTIYSPDVFGMAKDSLTMSPDALDEKYPQLAAAKQREIARSTASLEARRESVPSGKSLSALKAHLRVYSRTRLCTVLHVGEDYFIVAEGDEQARRTAYPMHHVASIAWQADIPLDVSVSYTGHE